MAAYTEEEIRAGAAFLLRMLPYLAEGMTFEDAGRAVLRRDNELSDAATAQTEQGGVIRTELASHVYQSVRAMGAVLKEAR